MERVRHYLIPLPAYLQRRNTERSQRLGVARRRRRCATAQDLLAALRVLFAVAKSGLFDRSFTFHLYSSPRDETVLSRLRSLSAYHRLAFPGLSLKI
ncbi:MAG: hypothetical protein HDR84_05240 [Bacteroides sp.]|nr:hypothetical protein [Bacteroides sp.]